MLLEDEPWQALLEAPLSEEARSKRAVSAPPVLEMPAGQQRPAEVNLRGGAWPSLREGANNGWDFCSESAEVASVVSEVPSEATTNSWVHVDCDASSDASFQRVPSPGLQEPPAQPAATPAAPAWGQRPRASFAELLKSQGQADACPLPTQQNLLPRRLPQPRRQRVQSPARGAAGGDFSDDDDDCVPLGRDNRMHGWNKGHKANHNVKLCRKVAYQVAARAQQSRQSRGFA